MEVMDISIANVALPHIAGGLSAGVDESTWILTSYLVSNAIVLPISAWLSDRFGRKRFYMSCVALFTASSFLCGLAPSLGALIFFRVLQGLGGGGLGPSEQAILADTFPAAKRGMAFAVYGMAVVLAPAIGPTLGGWITDQYSWRWIFFINVPFGILSLSLVSFMISDPPHMRKAREEAQRSPIDFTGLVLVATGLGALQVVLDKGQRDDWFASPFITWFTIFSVSALVVFVIWEWRQKHPIVHLRLYKNSSFAVANLLMLLAFSSLLGATLLIPQFAQISLGYTAEKAGELLSPGGFAILAFMPLVGFLSSRVDARYIIAFGLLVVSFALFRMTNLTLGIDYKTLMMWRVYQAAGMAFIFVPVNTLAYTDMRPESSNQVAAMTNLARNIGGSVGISAVTTLLARRTQIHQDYLSHHMFQYNPRLQQLLSEMTNRAATRAGSAQALRQSYARLYFLLQQQASVLAYIDIFWILGIITMSAIVLLFFAKKPKPGQAAMGH
ncbi:MAG: DHA2 family efflux MFS transporter permease subunit [Bryobacterales bacterium]|nr:DHA2 family efflux MFS transporter permease subunit [Bryobacterales bacterium]MBV9397610.1 DHA2 family efflux MFS transporter permease subunit [Bryobacterales bacterium]